MDGMIKYIHYICQFSRSWLMYRLAGCVWYVISDAIDYLQLGSCCKYDICWWVVSLICRIFQNWNNSCGKILYSLVCCFACQLLADTTPCCLLIFPHMVKKFVFVTFICYRKNPVCYLPLYTYKTQVHNKFNIPSKDSIILYEFATCNYHWFHLSKT